MSAYIGSSKNLKDLKDLKDPKDRVLPRNGEVSGCGGIGSTLKVLMVRGGSTALLGDSGSQALTNRHQTNICVGTGSGPFRQAGRCNLPHSNWCEGSV